MILLILGLVLWSAPHFWKRLAPASRESFGEKGKGIVTLAMVVSIVLMVIGYRGADGIYYWGRSSVMTGINNLLMLFAFYLFAASGSKARITRIIRHPQLMVVVVWCVAHLLVNGDTPSFVLFGGLLIWAVAEIVLINRAVPDWTPAHEVPLKKEISAVVATVVVFAIVAAIHIWLGYNPFG